MTALRKARHRLELQLAEQVQSTGVVLLGGALQLLVAGLQCTLDLGQLLLLLVALQQLVRHLLGQSIGDRNRVAGGHHVVVVNVLDEGLHALALLDLLVRHSLRGLAWCTLQTNNECNAKLVVLVPVIESLDDDSLAAGEPPVEEDDHAAGLAAIQKDDMSIKGRRLTKAIENPEQKSAATATELVTGSVRMHHVGRLR